MKTDAIVNIGESVVQHGDVNDRVYLMRLAEEDSPATIVRAIDRLAAAGDYSKIFAKVPTDALPAFEKVGFDEEARVPGYFHGTVDGCFLGKFRKAWRRRDDQEDKLDQVLETAINRTNSHPPSEAIENDTPRWRLCGPDDAVAAAALYGEVFPTYPFPIQNADYLRETMREDTVYFGIWDGATLAALSSAEMDPTSSSVEMTDFATRPHYRSRGLARFLLRRMETEMRRRGILTACTIARAVSYGINITFSSLGYAFGGRLVNNTNISGGLESMNVWHKPLATT